MKNENVPTLTAVTLLKTMRLPFLFLTLSSVFLGIATVNTELIRLLGVDTLLVIIGAVAAHLSVNLLNEHHDYVSGLDARTVKTPFSGGSGALMENPGAISAVYRLAFTTLGITVLIGIYFIINRGVEILPVGVLGLAIVLSYTPWLNKKPLLCLVAPGIAFGPLMVIGTHIAVGGEQLHIALYASLIPFFLVNNLLLVNQLPDIEADRSVGRYHVPIAYGLMASVWSFSAFAGLAVLVVIVGLYTHLFPPLGVIVLLPMIGQLFTGYGIRLYSHSQLRAPKTLLPYMAINVLVAISTPLVMGLVIIIGSSRLQ